MKGPTSRGGVPTTATGWLWRFVIWTVFTTPLSMFAARDYRLLIGKLVGLTSTWMGYPLELVSVGVGMPNDGLIFSNHRHWIQATCYAPVDLAFYAAMCLSTLGIDWKARVRILLRGAALLMAAHLALLALCLTSIILDAADGRLHFQTQLTWTRIMGTSPWVGPIAVWFLLIGRSRLAFRPVASMTSNRPNAGVTSRRSS